MPAIVKHIAILARPKAAPILGNTPPSPLPSRARGLLVDASVLKKAARVVHHDGLHVGVGGAQLQQAGQHVAADEQVAVGVEGFPLPAQLCEGCTTGVEWSWDSIRRWAQPASMSCLTTAVRSSQRGVSGVRPPG